jgi:enoyl-CoA hydratase
MKLVVNKAYESLGISSTQTLGLALDGYMRNTPDAQAFMQLVREEGVGAATQQRDGHFADYSSGPAARQPDASHVIEP